MQEQVEKVLSSAEDIIYICTALVLIIAAIRRVLVITAEQVHPTPEHAAAFRMTMLELALLAAMILCFVSCIFLLRRHGRDAPFEMEE